MWKENNLIGKRQQIDFLRAMGAAIEIAYHPLCLAKLYYCLSCRLYCALTVRQTSEQCFGERPKNGYIDGHPIFLAVSTLSIIPFYHWQKGLLHIGACVQFVISVDCNPDLREKRRGRHRSKWNNGTIEEGTVVISLCAHYDDQLLIALAPKAASMKVKWEWERDLQRRRRQTSTKQSEIKLEKESLFVLCLSVLLWK